MQQERYLRKGEHTMNVIDITSRTEKEKQKIRLAAYCRVSSNSEDQLHSFASQIRYYKDYERKHPQYTLVDIYADEGLTGTSMDKRDEMNRMIRDCKKGKIDRIIVKSVSRFARNTPELLTAVRLMKELGVSIYFEEQDIDTEKLNMEMIVTFPGMAAQQESEAISGNVRWSYKKRMESGDYNTSSPAYGFDLIDGKLVENEAEAKVIQRIFDLYLSGYGKQAIATMLNEEGIPKKKENARWISYNITYILNNERYMGDALLQKSYTTDTLPYRRKLNHGECNQYYVENSNPPIISREMYEAAQSLQKTRSYNPNAERTVSPLSRKLRCPDCGRSFRIQTVRGIKVWLCNAASSGTTQCVSRRLREQGVYDTFRLLTWKLKDHYEDLIGKLIRDIELMQDKTSENHGRISEIDGEIANLTAQNLVITRLHTNGILNAAEYAQQSADINQKISTLRAERKKKLSEDENDEQLDKLRELYDIFVEYEPRNSFDEELFEQIVERITVESSSSLTFHLIGGISLTEEIPEKGRCKTA